MIHDKKVLGVCGETFLANAKQSVITKVCVIQQCRIVEDIIEQRSRFTNISSPITWQGHLRAVWLCDLFT